MDDILNLVFQMIIDLQGFNEQHFGIFPNEQHDDLNALWIVAKKNPNKFISL